MKNIDTVSQSSEINNLFDLLEKNVPAPTPSVPALESGRPNADKLHYRHQPVINSVFKIPYSPDAEFKSLCQDCLRVVCHPTQQALDMANDEFFFCDCGGQLCACGGCSEEAALLARNGSAAIIELSRPATGIIREQTK
jgi:hypothetical protein